MWWISMWEVKQLNLNLLNWKPAAQWYFCQQWEFSVLSNNKNKSHLWFIEFIKCTDYPFALLIGRVLFYGYCFENKQMAIGGCHSSAILSAPTILLPQVSNPKHTMYAFLNLYYWNCNEKRTKINKRGRDWPIKKQMAISCRESCCIEL